MKNLLPDEEEDLGSARMFILALLAGSVTGIVSSLLWVIL